MIATHLKPIPPGSWCTRSRTVGLLKFSFSTMLRFVVVSQAGHTNWLPSPTYSRGGQDGNHSNELRAPSSSTLAPAAAVCPWPSAHSCPPSETQSLALPPSYSSSHCTCTTSCRASSSAGKAGGRRYTKRYTIHACCHGSKRAHRDCMSIRRVTRWCHGSK
jgi:hypothetical protein